MAVIFLITGLVGTVASIAAALNKRYQERSTSDEILTEAPPFKRGGFHTGRFLLHRNS